MYDKSPQLIAKIKSYEGPTLPLLRFLSSDEIKKMIDWSRLCFGGDHDNSMRLNSSQASNNDMTGSPQGRLKVDIYDFLSKKIEPLINPEGRLKIKFSFAFHANKKAYGIHTDSGYDPNEFIYKQGIIPLIVKPREKTTHTVIMKQKCYHSSSFPNIIKDLSAQKHVSGLDFKSPIDEENYKNYWAASEGRKSQMQGFTIDYPFEWKVGDTVIWDRSRVHCSSDFEATGVSFKLGLMWISKIVEIKNQPVIRT